MARLLVVGSSNTDMTVRLPRLPAPGQTVLGGELLTGPGGKGANQAVAAARAGGEVVFVTAVGDDVFGAKSLDLYRSEGLDVSHAKRVTGIASGVALIFVDDAGENMIGVAPGANARLGALDIDRLPGDLFTPDRLLLIAGLELSLEAVSRAVIRGAGARMRIVLNPAPAVIELATAELLEHVDVITPNRVELGLLSGRRAETETDLLAAARAVTELGPKAVVATLGAEGCLVVDGENVVGIPSHPVRADDTVGAGDAFTGALAVALAEGRPLAEAAAWATAAAAIAVTRLGAISALARRDEVDRLAASAASL
jgi:ribokinase